ncbi:SDR family NAD(P)-dependent oxidoreductase [Alkalicoccus daliensis]|uniref:Short-chain dehydrogenase n=1 Tax=Alkalicoccus daliensis TaxID=745820 RepID=A0A1H0AHG9_9BACI|nr:SDR family NAD(P)-dependent oxidoreductase [Alkalicoccus daliensis]SDN33032.1 Short-chain dehydrogenase [Alkalicoccus daliensis]
MTRRNILITGAGSGFGFILAKELSKTHTVIAVIRRVSDASALKKAGIQFIYQADITRTADKDRLCEELKKQFTAVDVLVNNAGFCQGGVTEALDDEDWAAQLQVNVVAQADITRRMLPYLRKSDQGKIIQMGSVSGITGLPGLGAYAASKFALRGWSESLRYELLPQGIYVTLLEISSYKTDIWGKSANGAKFSQQSYYENLENALKKHADQNASSSGDPFEILAYVKQIIKAEKPPFLLSVGRTAKLWKLGTVLLPRKILETLILYKTK